MQSNYSSGKRRHDILGLGTCSALVCSYPDAQFHSDTHETDSEDQIGSMCKWKCATLGQGVSMRSSVCLCEDYYVYKSVFACVRERETKRVRKSLCLWRFSQESTISYVLPG